MSTKCLIAAVFCVILVAPPVSADDDAGGWLYEASFGILDHDTDNLWSGFSREDGVDLNGELLFAPVAEVFGGNIHPALGASINTSGDTSKAYLGLRYRYEFEGGVFAGIGLGGAWHNGETDLRSDDKKALGSKILFHIPIEVGYRFTEQVTGSVYFDHISNGYTQDANEGMDTLGLRIGYRF